MFVLSGHRLAWYGNDVAVPVPGTSSRLLKLRGEIPSLRGAALTFGSVPEACLTLVAGSRRILTRAAAEACADEWAAWCAALRSAAGVEPLIPAILDSEGATDVILDSEGAHGSRVVAEIVATSAPGTSVSLAAGSTESG